MAELNKIIEIDRYRGFVFTTRISGNGLRIMLPLGNGILDFAEDVSEAKAKVDTYIASTL